MVLNRNQRVGGERRSGLRSGVVWPGLGGGKRSMNCSNAGPARGLWFFHGLMKRFHLRRDSRGPARAVTSGKLRGVARITIAAPAKTARASLWTKLSHGPPIVTHDFDRAIR